MLKLAHMDKIETLDEVDGAASSDAESRVVMPNGGLEVVSIAKSYDKRAVLTDISLHVAKGEVLGLLGPNGAGKTTCFYSIMGLVRPDSGRILMDGEDVTNLPMYRRAILGLGYLPQETSIFRGMTVEQNINCVLEMVEPDAETRAQELERLLDDFGLTRLRESPAMALSGGERRRCEIARALAAKPSIMLLDEPFAGIDPLSISDIRDLVKDLKQRGIADSILVRALRFSSHGFGSSPRPQAITIAGDDAAAAAGNQAAGAVQSRN